MADGNGVERRKNAIQMAKDIVEIKTDGKYVRQSIDTLVATVKEEHDEREKLGTRVTRIEERMTIWAAIQATYATLTAVVAGWVASLK